MGAPSTRGSASKQALLTLTAAIRRRSSAREDEALSRKLEESDQSLLGMNMSSRSLHSSSPANHNKRRNRERRVRFSGSRMTNSVKCTVREVDHKSSTDDMKDELWWNSVELAGMRVRDKHLERVSSEAREYLEYSLQLKHRIDQQQDGTKKSSSPSVAGAGGGEEGIATRRNSSSSCLSTVSAGFDSGFRGLESCIGSVGMERQRRTAQFVQSIVLFYKSLALDASSQGSDELAEQVQTFSEELTYCCRRLAAFYGKADAFAVANERAALMDQLMMNQERRHSGNDERRSSEHRRRPAFVSRDAD